MDTPSMIGSADAAAQLKTILVIATRADPRRRMLHVSGMADSVEQLVRRRSGEILDLSAKAILKDWH